MVEPLISNVKKSRFYRELQEETAQELTPKIEQETKRKIARELLLRKMNLELIAEATQLAPHEVRTIMKDLASSPKTRVTIQEDGNLSAAGKSLRNRRGVARLD